MEKIVKNQILDWLLDIYYYKECRENINFITI